MIYFTADTHFGHKNIIEYTKRPFATVEDMDSTMMRNWYKTVNANDEIYILGDFAFAHPRRVNELLASLPGKKYLVKGNHDSFLREAEFNRRAFEWVRDYHVVKYNGQMFVLNHYPMAVWDRQFHGSIHLYGHVHNDLANNHPMLKDLTGAYNVGVDVRNFTPVHIGEIIKEHEQKLRR